MKIMYTVNDVKEILSIGDSKAYAIIRDLNAELEKNGYMTVRGRVPAQYFNERFYGDCRAAGE